MPSRHVGDLDGLGYSHLGYSPKGLGHRPEAFGYCPKGLRFTYLNRKIADTSEFCVTQARAVRVSMEAYPAIRKESELLLTHFCDDM